MVVRPDSNELVSDKNRLHDDCGKLFQFVSYYVCWQFNFIPTTFDIYSENYLAMQHLRMCTNVVLCKELCSW